MSSTSILSFPFKGEYFFIPYEILYDTDLSPTERFIMADLINRSRCDECYVSAKDLSKRINVQYRSVLRALHNLDEKGYISAKVTLDPKTDNVTQHIKIICTHKEVAENE